MNNFFLTAYRETWRITWRRQVRGWRCCSSLLRGQLMYGMCTRSVWPNKREPCRKSWSSVDKCMTTRTRYKANKANLVSVEALSIHSINYYSWYMVPHFYASPCKVVVVWDGGGDGGNMGIVTHWKYQLFANGWTICVHVVHALNDKLIWLPEHSLTV